MRRASKQKRFDLWLDSTDVGRLDDLAAGWNISRQRVIEAALAHAVAGLAPVLPTTSEGYKREQRIVLNLDRLADAQIEQLDADASQGIRGALRAYHTAWTRK